MDLLWLLNQQGGFCWRLIDATWWVFLTYEVSEVGVKLRCFFISHVIAGGYPPKATTPPYTPTHLHPWMMMSWFNLVIRLQIKQEEENSLTPWLTPLPAPPQSYKSPPILLLSMILHNLLIPPLTLGSLGTKKQGKRGR